MAGEATTWDAFPLDDLTEEETPITYGVVKPGEEGDVPFVRGGDIAGGRVLMDQLRTIGRDVSQQYRRTLLRGGEILVSLVGNPGQIAIAPPSLAGANIARQVGLVRLKPGIDTRFVSYFLQSHEGQTSLGAQSLGSVQQVINLRDLKTVKVPLPPLAEQKAIAAVLGALDEKIELNRRMNATLEAMARALFQSWFVDFDPVRAKLDGRPPVGLDPATAALFPATFHESSLGPIPHGWRTAHLEEIASVGSGKRPEGRHDVLSPECNIPLYGGGGRMGYVPSSLYEKPILFTGRVGTLGLIFRTAEPSWPSDNTLIVEPQTGFFDFTYFVLKGFDLITLNRGSTQPLLTQTDLKRQSFVLPTEDIVKAFADVSEPSFRQMVSNERESRTLATLRDALLPKLLSGELSAAGAAAPGATGRAAARA